MHMQCNNDVVGVVDIICTQVASIFRDVAGMLYKFFGLCFYHTMPAPFNLYVVGETKVDVCSGINNY